MSENLGVTSIADHFEGIFRIYPSINRAAPDFWGPAVNNGGVKEIKLSDYNAKYLVLIFFPNDFSSGICRSEIIAFNDRVEEFKRISCELLACSTGSVTCHCSWISTERERGGLGRINIPLLSDKNCRISRDYGVLSEGENIAFRGLFIIDREGMVRHVVINDMTVGRSVKETLRLLRAIQHCDEYGEMCPADWELREVDTRSTQTDI
ncbi:peroxiredoxin 1-like [Centruroides sculpturatus]|uniref:peroxiredoxin 1-like n=1 Tax=Centruroides sculpturatus TaxID=218467 RepID=UPI000C6DF816|nr:peroxiredoxin 1-like [Centruroides sculpturatus]